MPTGFERDAFSKKGLVSTGQDTLWRNTILSGCCSGHWPSQSFPGCWKCKRKQPHPLNHSLSQSDREQRRPGWFWPWPQSQEGVAGLRKNPCTLMSFSKKLLLALAFSGDPFRGEGSNEKLSGESLNLDFLVLMNIS